MKSRNTKQKELIGEEIKKFNLFFTAEDLFNKIKKKDSGIGIATVYRFLRDAVDLGRLHSYTCERRIIYSVGLESHCHFTCEKCGKVDHVKISSIDFVKSKIEGSICHFQIDVSGICNSCLKRGEMVLKNF